MFEGCNDWRVVTLEKVNIINEEDQDIFYEFIYMGLIGTFETMITDDEVARGYYIVKWVSEPYMIKKK